MNVSGHLVQSMISSLRDRNIYAFHACLVHGFDPRCFVVTSSGRQEPFIVYVARCEFPEALRLLLIDRMPCTIDRNHGLQAFYAAVSSAASQSVVSVFLEASILRTFPILSLAEMFVYAMAFGCATIAQQVIEKPQFNVKGCIQLAAGRWERPVHLAVRHDQPDILKRLLQRGSDVDCRNCYNETALKVAVELANFEAVFTLLKFGADPNAPETLIPIPFRDGSLLGQFGVPDFPAFHSGKTASHITENADRVVRLMLDAGFKPTEKYWIRDLWVNKNFSKGIGQRLFNRIRHLPSMLEASVISGRQAVRSLMVGRGGTTFDDFVQALLLPTRMKQQLYINLAR